MITKMDQWGPFAPDLEAAERIARTRALRALTRVLTGSRGADLDLALAHAETDVDRLDDALDALNRLAALDRRKVLSSYSGLIKPLPGAKALKAALIRLTPRPPMKVLTRVSSRRVRLGVPAYRLAA